MRCGMKGEEWNKGFPLISPFQSRDISIAIFAGFRFSAASTCWAALGRISDPIMGPALWVKSNRKLRASL